MRSCCLGEMWLVYTPLSWASPNPFSLKDPLSESSLIALRNTLCFGQWAFWQRTEQYRTDWHPEHCNNCVWQSNFRQPLHWWDFSFSGEATPCPAGVAWVRFPDNFWTLTDSSVQYGTSHHRGSNVGIGHLPSSSYTLGNQVALLQFSLHFQHD